jgi:hypothetical protein
MRSDQLGIIYLRDLGLLTSHETGQDLAIPPPIVAQIHVLIETVQNRESTFILYHYYRVCHSHKKIQHRFVILVPTSRSFQLSYKAIHSLSQQGRFQY